MRLKLPSDAQPREIPVVTIAVIVVCVGLWLAQVAGGVPIMGGRPVAMVDRGACVSLYVLTGEPWRLVSAMFLHFDLVHLGLNMLIFGGTAPQVERVFGSLRTLTIFLVGGILANAGFVA